MGGQDNGNGQTPSVPAAYSTRVAYDGSGYSSDGYNVVVNAQQLDQAATTFTQQLQGKNREQMQKTMSAAVVDPSAFGTIPNNAVAYAAVQQFVTEHLDAMHEMGISIADFIGRVQAAAQIATETDPATKAEAARAAAMLKRMAF